jgi:serine/threonine-protein kinase
MNRPAFPAEDAAREERLAALVTEVTEALRRGESPDVERLARQHPDIAVELRELWAAASIAVELGKSAAPLGWHAVSLGSACPREAEGMPPGAAREPADATQDRTIGDHELLEELGRGGMGIVYKARQTSLGRTVALKMILARELASAADVARFRAEAESAARLDHPNIVPVYAVSDHEGQPYFTMKYVEGTTLARALADGPLPAREAAELLAPVCRAIHYAHQQGVLHRGS